MKILGISSQSRQRLSQLLRLEPGLITPEVAARHLSLPRDRAARDLARWAKAGWLARVRRGAYTPVPLEAASPDIAIEDAWIVAASLFAPCYIAGWSAAEHWGLTDQIFRSVCVVTSSRPRKRSQNLRGAEFSLHSTTADKVFGTQSIWRHNVRVAVSDPARTMVDMLSDPSLGGGIRSVSDMLDVFFHEQRKFVPNLGAYAIRLRNGAVFKRLGFLLERTHPNEGDLISLCRTQLTTGYAALDPKLTRDKLITSWHLWVPLGWKN